MILTVKAQIGETGPVVTVRGRDAWALLGATCRSHAALQRQKQRPDRVRLLELAREHHHSFPIARIKPLVQISNAILHGKRSAAVYGETHILEFFKILKAVIENAPAPQ
jgi:hypothetical protein